MVIQRSTDLITEKTGLTIEDLKFYALLILTVGIITAGTVVYHYLEHLSWIDAYYFSVVTLTTVGYGDFSPVTDTGKIFTTGYILVGIGIIVSFVTVLAERFVENSARKQEKRRLARTQQHADDV